MNMCCTADMTLDLCFVIDQRLNAGDERNENDFLLNDVFIVFSKIVHQYYCLRLIYDKLVGYTCFVITIFYHSQLPRIF